MHIFRPKNMARKERRVADDVLLWGACRKVELVSMCWSGRLNIHTFGGSTALISRYPAPLLFVPSLYPSNSQLALDPCLGASKTNSPGHLFNVQNLYPG